LSAPKTPSTKDESSYLQIVRWNGPLGSFPYLADTRGADYGLKNGDILKASAIGSVITVYVNGVQKAQAVDDAGSRLTVPNCR
jgi:hypothetical protein